MKQAARKAGFVLLTIGVVAGLIAVLIGQLSRPERDRHALRRLVWDIEKKLRAHDGGQWLIVEGGFPPGVPHPEVEPVHEQLQADLERLAHLVDLKLVVEDVEVGDETATVDYRVESAHAWKDEPPVPRAGRFAFRRGHEGWALVGHSFREPAQGTERAPSPPQRGRYTNYLRHEALAVPLGAIAFLALLAGGGLLVQPLVAKAIRERGLWSRRR